MKLEDWRKEIDAIDTEIVRLINQRAAAAEKIGELKSAAGLPIVDVDREEAILRGICGKNQGAIENESLIKIFRRIILESRRVQIKFVGRISEDKAEIYR